MRSFVLLAGSVALFLWPAAMQGFAADAAQPTLSDFVNSPLKPDDPVSQGEARSFVAEVYRVIEDRVFDPAWRAEERRHQAEALAGVLGRKPSWKGSRGSLCRIVR